MKEFSFIPPYLSCTRKRNFDRSFFRTIDSEEKAYWLGFFYADGYVYKSGKQISITQKATEAAH